MTCKQWDIAVIPFPFVDTSKSKPRPVLILSTKQFIKTNNHCIAAMITSAGHTEWFGDTPITDAKKSGLKKQSVIRLKLFTLDLRFEPRIIGQLSKTDQDKFLDNFSKSIF